MTECDVQNGLMKGVRCQLDAVHTGPHVYQDETMGVEWEPREAT